VLCKHLTLASAQKCRGDVDTQLYSRFVHRLLENGIYMTPSNGLHWIISTAHTDSDLAALIEAADRACADLA
jgi:glutamate-1-semialdehyde 2,1-aminomutase